MTNKLPTITMMDLNSIDPKEARILIAKDVLALLSNDSLRPRAGWYFSADVKSIGDTDPDRPMHEVLQSLLASRCDVCALGAAWVASVLRFDALRLGDLDLPDGTLMPKERGKLMDYLGKFFDPIQLDLIEAAFEADTNMYMTHEDDVLESAVGYRTGAELAISDNENERFSAEADRACLRRIFENIINNDGTFVPEKR